MKKIVGIIAAVAMAGSLFAADFTMKSQINASLFNVTQTKIKDTNSTEPNKPIVTKSDVTALGGLAQGKTANYAEMIGLSISDDKAGGEMKVWAKDGKDPSDLVVGKYSVWFKPLDMIKITIGNWGTNLNQEHMDWWRAEAKTDSQGFAVSVYPMDGLSFDVAFLPGWGGNWFKTNDDGLSQTEDEKKAKGYITGKEDAVLAETFFKVAYAADGIGTINAMFDAKPAELTLGGAGDDKYQEYDSVNYKWNDIATPTDAAKKKAIDNGELSGYRKVAGAPAPKVTKSFADLKFGAGYNNTFGDITVWANVLGYANYKVANIDIDLYKKILKGEVVGYTGTCDAYKMGLEKVRLELDANSTVDALSWEVYLPVDIYMKYANAAYSCDYINDTKAEEMAFKAWEMDNYNSIYGAAPSDAEKKVYEDSGIKFNPVAIGFCGKVAYALDNGLKVSFQAEVNNFLAKDLSISLKPKVEGSIGLLSWNAALDFGINACSHIEYADKATKEANGQKVVHTDADGKGNFNPFKLNVPVEFSLAF